MNTELKNIWIPALRSGGYIQNRDQLHDRGAFCCLGVLCDIQGAEWVPTGSFLEVNWPKRCRNWARAVLPSKYKGGLTEEEIDTLVDMNRDYDFEQIADHIEENF